MRQTILGTPSMPGHLPEAEAILPGHTLIRPALGMLKSSVKFPHKDLDNGAGVYGNIDNLGITWDGTGERVLYTGFRRANDEDEDMSLEENNEVPHCTITFKPWTRKSKIFESNPIKRFNSFCFKSSFPYCAILFIETNRTCH
ncbi:uncharacterized protein LOC113492927 [Trichoplusia ni]|uniref:Uncharacterized protein LOC113492927 n=1 Tax=Trichoplusia ni TaxID=7111 RepID=A0A7E5VDS7_TRINI|nr:uncharacterized protein LOC113492927 [Trichoplusia ni]